MNWLLCILSISLIHFSVYAQDPQALPPTALVHKIIGTATLDGVELKTGDLIEKPGVLETKEKSLIQIKIAKWNNSISIGPNSKMTLNFTNEKKYTLEQGTCRWKTALKDAVKEGSKGKIFTKNVAMGVRGTDFLIKSFPLFGETEIIMLDGEVQMDNLEDPTNSVIVKKGQWGGLGGRYGKKINPPLDLPKSVLDTFEKTIEAP